jgi:hypothetical protein
MATAVISDETVDGAITAAVQHCIAALQEGGIFEPVKVAGDAIGIGRKRFRELDEDAMLDRVLAQMEPWAMMRRIIESNAEMAAMLTGIPARHLITWAADTKPPPEVYVLSIRAAQRAERKVLETLGGPG